MINRKVLIINKYILMLGIILICNLGVFYLVDDSKVNLSDLTLILELFFFLYVYMKNRTKVKYKYKIFILLCIGFSISSAIMAKYSYGQPVFMGIRPQRAWLACMIMYFPITKLLYLKKINLQQIIKLIKFICVCLIVITIIQYIVGGKYVFMNVMNNQRYGSIRLYISTGLIIIYYFVNLSEIFKMKQIKFKNLFAVITTLFVICFIVKSRMLIVSLIGATTIFIIYQKMTVRKIFLIIIAIVLIIAFLNTSSGQDILGMITSGQSISDNTSEIRDLGREFYIEKNSRSILTVIFGSGYVNIDWPNSAIMSGYSNKYYYNDNGIIGLYFYYGISFIIWLITFYFVLIHQAYRKKHFEFSVILLYGLLGSLSLIPDCYSSNLAFVFTCILIEHAEQLDLKQTHIRRSGE